MEILYQLKRIDYVDSAAMASRARRSVFLFDALVAGFSVVVGLFCCGMGYFLLGVLLLVLSWFFVLKRIYGWQTIRLPTERAHEIDRIVVRLSDEAFEYETLAFKHRFEWGAFSHYLEDDHRFLLIYRAQKLFFIIPQRAFVDEQQRKDARRYFGAIKNAAPVVPPIAEPH